MTGLSRGLTAASVLLIGLPIVHAGELADNHVSIDLSRLNRDSDASVEYVFDNAGTVNNAIDDIPLGSTDSFDEADTGYLVSASLRLSDRWSANVVFFDSEMDSADSFSDASGQLEIFRMPITSEFDAAHSVQARYESDLSGFDLNAVYRINESVDLFAGIGILDLDEQFRLTSDDSGSAGIGRYTIHTGNSMEGVHVGLALNRMLGDKFGVYFIGKIGSYDNDSEQRQRVDDPSLTRVNSDNGSATSTISDLRLGLRYLFAERLRLDFGYRRLGIDNVALAEGQFDTSLAGPAGINDGSSVDWDGFSLGLKVGF